ncbi:hypothetical protein LCGC14_0466820 [marine sediment metagenome]|uniref:Uncharacterized protein n=1 Tax=marine sediment metagenome TaxID=412755 RepID=A0A0F9SWB4_9ZZZZ
MADTSKIRVLETRHQGNHREVVKQLKECLAIAKDDPEIHTVIVCLEDRSKNVTTYWSPCEDRAWLGSRLILAGMRRMGFKT